MKLIPATSFLQRSCAFIAHLLNLQEQNERILASSRMLALPAPRNASNATASTWERDAPICEKHSKPMFRSLVETDSLKFGEHYCSQCEQERHEATILQLQSGKLHALFPNSGELASRIRLAETRHHMQEEAIKDIIAGLSTHKDLSDTPEAALLPQRTSPLPARDITLASTPRNPATPTPEARETLFADVSNVPHEEDEDDITERRQAVKTQVTRDTRQIPAITAEMYLLEAMRHDTAVSEHNTGESERLPVQVNWML